MKKALNIVFLFFLCFSGGMLGSCTDEMSEGGGENDGKVTLHVKFGTKAGAVEDPESLNESEYRIHTIRLYAFDGDVLDNMVYVSGLGNVTGSAVVDIDVKVSDNKTFYAVVNEPNDDKIHTALALANHPNGIKQVQYSMAEYLNSKANALTHTEKYFLPMYQEMQSPITKTTGSLEIRVDRAVARVDVYMIKANGVTSNASTDQATLTVEHSAINGYIAKDNVMPANPDLTFSMNNPVAKTLKAYNEDRKEYTKIYSFYVPEQSCTEEGQRLKFTLGGILWNNVVMPQPYNAFYLGNDGNNTGGTKLDKIERNKVYQLYCRLKPTSENVELTIITQPWNLAPVQEDESEKGEVNMINCYMVPPGGGTIIPVSNVYKIWAWVDELEGQFIPNDATVVPEVIWSDTEGLITSVSLLPSGGSIDDKDHARIKIQAASGKQGNAVVGIRMKGADGNLEAEYRWSWHIWVTDYNPEILNGDYNGFTFMDRNIGAISNTFDIEARNGLFFQWGRKDPFPGTDRWTTNLMSTYGVKSYEYSELLPSALNNLANAINNPNIFYASLRSKDWCTSDDTKIRNDRWNINGKKNIYDPCPEGWRVPVMSEGTISPWNGLSQRSNFKYAPDLRGNFHTAIGYYPNAGRIKYDGKVMDVDDGSDSQGAGVGYLLTATFDPFEQSIKFAGGFIYNGRLPSDVADIFPAEGIKVRCVKE